MLCYAFYPAGRMICYLLNEISYCEITDRKLQPVSEWVCMV